MKGEFQLGNRRTHRRLDRHSDICTSRAASLQLKITLVLLRDISLKWILSNLTAQQIENANIQKQKNLNNGCN